MPGEVPGSVPNPIGDMPGSGEIAKPPGGGSLGRGAEHSKPGIAGGASEGKYGFGFSTAGRAGDKPSEKPIMQASTGGDSPPSPKEPEGTPKKRAGEPSTPPDQASSEESGRPVPKKEDVFVADSSGHPKEPKQSEEAREGGESSRENPAEQETVDTVASNLKEIMGEDNEGRIPIGDDSRRTLEFSSQPVDSGIRRGGRDTDVTVTNVEMFFEGGEVDTRTTLKRYRLGTSMTHPPQLLVATDTPEEYLASERRKYEAQVEARRRMPEEKQWKPSTEEQASELGAIVEVVLTETKEGREMQGQVIGEFDRILRKAGKEAVNRGGSKEINFYSVSDDDVIKLVRDEKGVVSRVGITPQGQDERIVFGWYELHNDTPIKHISALQDKDTYTENPATTTYRQEVVNLVDMLSSFSDEVIENELNSRKAIRKGVDQVLKHEGIKGPDVDANIKRSNFTVTVSKFPVNGSSGFGIEIHDQSEPKFLDRVRAQVFRLAPGWPLQVRTVRYGDKKLSPMTVATEGQKEYVMTLLDELSH